MERVSERVQWLALTQAISQLKGVDRRLLALFWHLAERWGRITPSGIVVSLALSHRELGQLVGARRPTISTALAERGELTRRSDGRWLLTGEPTGVPSHAAQRIIERRTRRLPPLAPSETDVEQRERALDERERRVESREHDAEARQFWADERDHAADARERFADDRDREADDHNREADEHYGVSAQPDRDHNE